VQVRQGILGSESCGVFFAIAIAVALSACTSKSGVIPDGPDRYIVIVSGKTGFTPVGDLKISAYKQASGYCSSRGKRMETIEDKSVRAGFGRFPEAEIRFKCVAASDGG
jgi:hypothetical protein